MATKDKKGIVYVVKNPSFKDDIIKIGLTRNLKQRLNDLSGSNVPYPFECLYACEVKDCREVESAIHDMCKSNRIRKEFFNADPKPIIRLLKQLSVKEITKDVDKAIDKKVPVEKTTAKVVTEKSSIPEGYKSYKDLKKYLAVEKDFKYGYFTIRLAATHKWKKIPLYQFQNERFYSQEVFREQAKNEGILAK